MARYAMVRYFNLGKINLYGTGKRYPVTVRVSLEEKGGSEKITLNNGAWTGTGEFTPKYLEFSAMGNAGAAFAGQCLDRINQHRDDFSPQDRETWDKIYRLWKLYHLNGSHPGTPEQEQYLKDVGCTSNYNLSCDYLKAAHMYTVNFTGRTTGREYHDEPYTYGTGWIIRDIPEDDLTEIKNLLEY